MLLLVAALQPAAAQNPAPRADPEGVVVAELVVHARTPGPAWWRVSKGSSVVWVLGVPGGLPKNVRWDSSVLSRRLTGARRLILPPAYGAGLGDLFGALALRSKLRSPTPIEPELPPDLRARYLAAASTLGQPPQQYDHWKPVVSGLFMLGDFRKRAGLDEFQPTNAIRALAGRKGVKLAPAATYRAIPVMRALAGHITEAVNLSCLGDSLDEIEAGLGGVRSAAAAWAQGDVAGALTAERGFEKCLASFPEVDAQIRQTFADETAAIARDLQTPGVSVAAIPLRSLVAQDGVLSRLQAAGYEVRTPGSD